MASDSWLDDAALDALSASVDAARAVAYQAARTSRHRFADYTSTCPHTHTSEVYEVADVLGAQRTHAMLRCRGCGLYIPLGPANDDMTLQLLRLELALVEVDVHVAGERAGYARCGSPLAGVPSVGQGWATHGRDDRVAALEAQLREQDEVAKAMASALATSRAVVRRCPTCEKNTLSKLQVARRKLDEARGLERPSDAEEM